VIDYEIVIAHAHLSRDKATEQLVYTKRGAPDRWLIHTPQTIVPWMDQYGVSNIVTLNVMNTIGMIDGRLRKAGLDAGSEVGSKLQHQLRVEMQDRVSRLNRWALEAHAKEPRIFPCVFIDPVLFDDLGLTELETCIAQGANAVKMHPGLSRFRPDDRSIWPLFDRIQELGVPIVFDTGFSRGTGPAHSENGRPIHFADMLGDFPRLIVVMAHLAADFWDERIRLAERYPNLMFDTAGGFTTEDHFGRGGRRAACEEDAVRIIRAVGVERVMFGTDQPAHDPAWQFFQMARLTLDETERRLVLSENARRVYRL
jgi:uncharacterized protein